MLIPGKFKCAFGVGSLHVSRPNHAPTLRKGHVDVFPLVFVCAVKTNVSALLNTDLFIKIWVGHHHAAGSKAAHHSKINPT